MLGPAGKSSAVEVSIQLEMNMLGGDLVEVSKGGVVSHGGISHRDSAGEFHTGHCHGGQQGQGDELVNY
jgi:hypothetical protein